MAQPGEFLEPIRSSERQLTALYRVNDWKHTYSIEGGHSRTKYWQVMQPSQMVSLTLRIPDMDDGSPLPVQQRRKHPPPVILEDEDAPDLNEEQNSSGSPQRAPSKWFLFVPVALILLAAIDSNNGPQVAKPASKAKTRKCPTQKSPSHQH